MTPQCIATHAIFPLKITLFNMFPVISKKPSSPRPIPRPGRKRFLASVLTILSQSTTGTQYPDHDDPEPVKKIDKTKNKLKKKKEEEAIQEDSIITASSSKKKQKYRSKVLNDHNNDFEQLVILKSTKEITHTPSNYSNKSNNLKEPENIKWADILPPLVKNGNPDHMNLPEDNRNVQDKKDGRGGLVEKDPSTMVAEVPKKEEKKLYNFFVDLLETTFSVYNVKTEFNPQPVSSVNSSKVALEIDESVAKKLNIQKIRDHSECSDDKCCPNPSKHVYCIKPDDNEVWDSKPGQQSTKKPSSKRSRPVSPTKSLKKKRRLHSESFDQKKTKPIPITTSLTIPNKKTLLRKDRKKTFINMLKDQLKMEECVFEEPQNFFQALKVIARNKRRCQKSIHFNETMKKSSEGDVHVCQFKRRRLLSASTNKSSKKSYRPESEFMRPMRSFNNSDITSSTRKRTIAITETEHELDPSQHSLEVYGFDYELNTHKRFKHDSVFGYNSSVSTYHRDYFANESLTKYSDSGASSLMQSPSHISEKHGLRSLSRLLEK